MTAAQNGDQHQELPLLIGVTGASGTIYAFQLLRELKKLEIPTHLIMSKMAQLVASHEGYGDLSKGASRSFSNDDFFAPPASGTALYRGMVIAPCSMGTLGRISSGISDTLITRAADVQLKEGRSLILLPREAPFSEIHLENLLRLKRAGATILPASPHFYNRPQTVEEVVNSVIAKVLDQLQIDHKLAKPWGSSTV